MLDFLPMRQSARLLPVVLLLPLAALAAAAPPPATHAAKTATPAAVAKVLATVSPDRLRSDIDHLAGFGTRHTLSDTVSETRGIGAARRWIAAQFELAAKTSGRSGAEAMTVRFDGYTQKADGKRVPSDTEIVDVVAELPGSMPAARARRVYVVGHYDSRASDPNDATSDAPGANDDGSGTATLLELARVLAPVRTDATIVLLATAGEEQGLFGAKHHAEAAREQGLDIEAVLNNDIVGDPSPRGGRHDREIRVFSEGLPVGSTAEQAAAIRGLAAESDSPSRELARYVAEVARGERLEIAPQLIFRPDRFLRGGDHLAFNQAGYAAVRFTTVEENYDRQHQNVRRENGIDYGDVPARVDPQYLARVVRLNAAAALHLANAPAPPANVRVVTAELGYDTVLRWSAPPEPDLAGCEAVWRSTTSPTWERAQDAGRATEITLPLNKDDVLLGVRCYDRDGYRSPVAFARIGKD